jgi:hypothetical protein
MRIVLVAPQAKAVPPKHARTTICERRVFLPH